jgi:hypothetical protein
MGSEDVIDGYDANGTHRRVPFPTPGLEDWRMRLAGRGKEREDWRLILDKIISITRCIFTWRRRATQNVTLRRR